MNVRRKISILTICVITITLGLATTAHAVVILKAGDTTGNYSDNVAVTVSETMRGECVDTAQFQGDWECSGGPALNNPREAQLEFLSLLLEDDAAFTPEKFGSVSVALASEQYVIDSLSSLDAQITGQIRYDGTMYVFQYNGVDIAGLIELETGQLGTKVQTVITVALVDVTDPNNNFEVGNTTVLDAECEAAYEIALGISVLANKCTHILQPTYSFNAIVQPNHTYEIVVDLRCDAHAGSPGFNLVGCKYGARWDSGINNEGRIALSALGAIGDYVKTIDAIGRPGGLMWANSTISLGQDVRAEREIIITRLETALGLLGVSLKNNSESQLETLEMNIKNTVLEAKTELESSLIDNGEKTEEVNINVINNGKKTEEVIRLVSKKSKKNKKK